MKLLCDIRFSEAEIAYIKAKVEELYDDSQTLLKAKRRALEVQLEKSALRLSRLTDGFIDNVVDKDVYIGKRNSLTLEQRTLRERLQSFQQTEDDVLQKLKEFLELSNSAYLSYKRANDEEKRELAKIVTSNFSVRQKNVLVKLNYPFQIIVNRRSVPHGGAHRTVPRTLSALVSQLVSYFDSRKAGDEEKDVYRPVNLTPSRQKLAFRRANAGPEELAA
jgi:hypothetical protein